MAASIISEPAYPVQGQLCKITFDGLHADTNFVRLFPVSAPIGSKLREALDAAKGQLAEVHSGASGLPWNFTPDKGGVYTFKLDETATQPSSGSLFENDPTGAPQPTPTQSGSVVLYVGQKLEMTLGASPNEVTLRLFVWNDTIRSTTVAVHGEDTPALVNATSVLAENASYDTSVLDAVAALDGLTATAAAGTLPADFLTARGLYIAHASNTTAHTNNDDVNALSTGWTAANTKAAEEAIRSLRFAIDSHTKQLTDVADATVHPIIDGTTAFVSNGANDEPQTQFFALADAIVRIQQHAALSGTHASVVAIADQSVGPLTALCIALIEALQDQTPTIPTAKNPGAARLGQLAGFKEA